MKPLLALFSAIARRGNFKITPQLARATADSEQFLDAICLQQYEGDTALHIAAAAYSLEFAHELVKAGADVRARNRRGAEPLHYAVDGVPGSATWNPRAQAAMIEFLIKAGADVDAGDITPLHRAVRNRCSAAVEVLLLHGADPQRKSKRGTKPIDLTRHNTGRGGSGSIEARTELQRIVSLLRSKTR